MAGRQRNSRRLARKRHWPIGPPLARPHWRPPLHSLPLLPNPLLTGTPPSAPVPWAQELFTLPNQKYHKLWFIYSRVFFLHLHGSCLNRSSRILETGCVHFSKEKSGTHRVLNKIYLRNLFRDEYNFSRRT